MLNSMTGIFLSATWDTLLMIVWSTAFAVLVGLPVGVFLWGSARGGCFAMPKLHRVVSVIVNIMRSVPFIILMVALIPITRWIVGSSIGTAAAIVPLAVGAIPFFARLVHNALKAVPVSLTEACEAMGATPWQMVSRVIVSEALPMLVRGMTLTAVTLVGYSAMAGAVGGGGLGDVAIRYGYNQFDLSVMSITVVILVVLVQLIQWLGDAWANKLDHS